MFVNEKTPSSLCGSACHPLAVPIGTVQLQKCPDEILCFVIVLFLNTTTQTWLFRYGTLQL